MKKKIIKILNETLKVEEGILEQFDENAELIDLGLDSLNAIEIIVILENTFNISVEDEDLLIDNINTISKLITLVTKYQE